MHKKNIFITGRPRVGKTSLIKECARLLGIRAGGFYTEEIQGEGVRGRKGFCLITLSGKKTILAEVDVPAHYHVGRYGIHLEVMDQIAVPALIEAIEHKDWILIDEIGKMEEGSVLFKETVQKALNSSKHVLAAIRLRDDPFTKNLKERPDVQLIKITAENRDLVFKELSNLLNE